MQQIFIYQSLLAMRELYPGARATEQNIQQIADAGFDGISVAWLNRAMAGDAWEVARGAGLQVEGICLPSSVDDFKRSLDIAAEFPIQHLVLQANVRPQSLAACASLVEGWLKLTEQVSYPVYLETHRNQLTNDLFFTIELIDRYPQIKLLADISHYVVARAFSHPVTNETNDLMKKILDRSWAFHGRVASSDQVQVEVSLAHNKKWVDQFADWWAFGFASWRRRAAQDRALTFTCELLPPPAAIRGRDGSELSNRWEESLLLRELALRCWNGHPTQA